MIIESLLVLTGLLQKSRFLQEFEIEQVYWLDSASWFEPRGGQQQWRWQPEHEPKLELADSTAPRQSKSETGPSSRLQLQLQPKSVTIRDAQYVVSALLAVLPFPSRALGVDIKYSKLPVSEYARQLGKIMDGAASGWRCDQVHDPGLCQGTGAGAGAGEGHDPGIQLRVDIYAKNVFELCPRPQTEVL
jgi:hypothetical protein